MITIAELFPLYSTCTKWLEKFRAPSLPEGVRLINEYVMRTTIETPCEILVLYTLDHVKIHFTHDSIPIE